MLVDITTYIQEHIDDFIYASLSEPAAKQPIIRMSIKPVMVKGKLHLQLVSFDQKKSYTKNIPISQIKELLNPIDAFKTIFLRFRTTEMHCSRRKDGSWSVRTKKLEQSLSQDIVHNRKKAYLLQEGEPIDALIELGIQSKNGKIIHSSYAKFIQINRFLELVSDVLPSKKTLHIVDFGSGKAYLSFMLYHVLSKQYDVHMIGIEQNEELVTKSNLLAQKLRFSNLRFEHASIDTCTLQNSIDIALALHACDTATDQAILQAMKYHAAVILCAPCCQHELAQQIDPKTLPLFFKHNLLRERYAALLTDALRVRFLELHGYKTQVIEFVDPEHSPKNLLIRAVRTGKKPSEEEMNEYTKTIEQLKIRPFLCRNTLSTPARR